MEILLLTDLSSIIFFPFDLEVQTAFIFADKMGWEGSLALRLTGTT